MATESIDSTMDLGVHILFFLVGKWPHSLIRNNDIGTEKLRTPVPRSLT